MSMKAVWWEIFSLDDRNPYKCSAPKESTRERCEPLLPNLSHITSYHFPGQTGAVENIEIVGGTAYISVLLDDGTRRRLKSGKSLAEGCFQGVVASGSLEAKLTSGDPAK